MMDGPDGADRTAREDQERAAVAHAQAALSGHVEALPGGGDTVSGVRPAPWLLDAVARHNRAQTDGNGWHCPHAGRSPGLLVVAVWRPGRTWCADCAARPGSGIMAASDREEYTCDACGAFVPETGVFIGVTVVGHTMIYFAVCPPCKARYVGGAGQ